MFPNTFSGADYITEIIIAPPNCFGSKEKRYTAPIGEGLSSSQKRNMVENFTNIGPGSYHNPNYSALYELQNKVRSKKGVGFLASDAPRFKYDNRRTPSPTRYETRVKRPEKKQGCAPFGIRSEIVRFKIDDNPGPGTYNICTKKCRKMKFHYNFGHPKMIHAVNTYCIPCPSDNCSKCGKLCKGDYWHKEFSTFLCQFCWDEEKRTSEIYTMKQLKEFKKIRNCSYVHKHEGTPAALRILPQKKVVQRARLENYLSLYYSC